ncbi:MAG: Ig-like domain-containing protein [Ruminococcus sp.]|nr:Ig-like domain-containing protein [Ruminococcus sp.]
MQFKKSKTFLAALLAGTMACSAMLPSVASAAGTRTKSEAYGDDTYAARFMSLYDDVVTNGVENGYMSSTSTVSGGLGIPYHSVEELCIEAPDYGHETTSEALSYLVWVAAMRDNIVSDANSGEITVAGEKDAADEEVGDLAKAWLTLESTMIPDVQGASSYNFMSMTNLSATYSDEWEQVELYPTDMASGNTATNPIHSYFVSSYGAQGDKGLYLMHWLADVDDWYGYGNANGSSYKQANVNGSFTLINTFQRGEQESCWETIPHACIDTHGKYGLNGNGGMKGFFNTESSPAEQWSYTNAPDAEDRAIQAVYAANRWGVGDQSITTKWTNQVTSLTDLAAKMGDETRNNMYDKYYKAIGCGANITSSNSAKWTQSGGGVEMGKHYLMNWYTSWGGALQSGQGDWAWQIGASHIHEFYQNPLAAYALGYDNDSAGNNVGLSNSMDSQGAVSDFQTSLERQIELYLWLLSADGPIAGGCTNSYQGRYTGYSDLVASGEVTTFYDMMYLEHPVYADPGSNHWIGNQVWAVQRLAELYYVVQGTDDANIQIANTGYTLSAALEKILDRWVGWFMDNTILGVAQETTTITYQYEPYDEPNSSTAVLPVLDSVVDDGTSFSIPSSLIWEGTPETWTGSYTENSNLHCTIVGYGDGDLGCVSSLANTLLYYAKAKGVSGSDLEEAETSYKNKTSASETSSDELAKQSLYLAKELLDREWDSYRDDIGLGVSDHNTNLVRLWETELVLPNGTTANGEGKVLSASRYVGTMANGDQVKDGVSFVDIRSNYKNCEMYQTALDYYNGNGEDNDGDGSVTVSDYYFTLHRFWHAGDIMMALGAMYELYPEVTPDSTEVTTTLTVTPDDIELTIEDDVAETETLTPNVDGCTFSSADTSVAIVDENGVVTAVGEGKTTITVTDPDGNTATVTVTVTETITTTETTLDTTTTTTTTDAETTETDVSGTTTSGGKLGDVNLDGVVNMADTILLNKYVAGSVDFIDQQVANGDCYYDGAGDVNNNDALSLLKFQVQALDSLPEK